MVLLVHSKSTTDYIEDWSHSETLLISHHPTKKTLQRANSEGQVIAIGGGSVIDAAKIISTNPIIAIPTTFAGASRTSHAVYWDEDKKCNYNAKRPVTILKPEYLKTLSMEFYQYSKTDCICHAIESLISKRATEESTFYASIALELVRKGTIMDDLTASLLAADAIEINKTNLLHALSYPLTTIYHIPHGKALSFLLPRVLPYIEDMLGTTICVEDAANLEVDMEKVIDAALTYPKIFETRKPINKEILRKMLIND